MAREFAQPFYKSKKWLDCRIAYLSQVNYVCERCDKPADLVHHKTYINEANITDPNVTLNSENLEALCYECHGNEHKQYRRRPVYTEFDDEGNPMDTKPCIIVTGAPGSGKTTYVNENKQWGDLVFDLDFINAALNGDLEKIYKDHQTVLPIALEIRNTVYNCIERHTGTWGKAYVITTQANMWTLQDLAHRLNAEIVVMDTSKEECKRRVNEDFRRRNKTNLFNRLIDKWFDDYESSST